MSWFGYLVLLLAMAALTASCFLFALKELLRPVDPGPLAIPEPGGTARARAEPGLPGPGARGLTPAPADAANGASPQPDADAIPIRSQNRSAAPHSVSAVPMVLQRGTRLESAIAPLIRVEGAASPPHLPELETAVEGQDAGLSSLIAEGRPLDEVVAALTGSTSDRLSGVALLRRAEHLGLLQRVPVPLAGWLAPTWLGAVRGWYLGAGTARLHGSLDIQAGACVPFHLIVKGSVRAEHDVSFHGSLHASGDVELGQQCVVFGSVTSASAVRVGSLSLVSGCIGAGADVHLGAYCGVGSTISGGIASGGRVTLQSGTAVLNRISAKTGIECG